MSEQNSSKQLATFFVDGDQFGIEVMRVQEVTGETRLFNVPLAPHLVRGLVNLRGQIATAIGLREAFSKATVSKESQMSVVCKVDGMLISLIVDSIGDVVEVDGARFEPAPDTIPDEIKKYVKGIYKMDGVLLSVLDLDVIGKELSPVEIASEQALI